MCCYAPLRPMYRWTRRLYNIKIKHIFLAWDHVNFYLMLWDAWYEEQYETFTLCLLRYDVFIS